MRQLINWLSQLSGRKAQEQALAHDMEYARRSRKVVVSNEDIMYGEQRPGSVVYGDVSHMASMVAEAETHRDLYEKHYKARVEEYVDKRLEQYMANRCTPTTDFVSEPEQSVMGVEDFIKFVQSHAEALSLPPFHTWQLDLLRKIFVEAKLTSK